PLNICCSRNCDKSAILGWRFGYCVRKRPGICVLQIYRCDQMRPAKRMPSKSSKSSKIESRPKKRKASSNGHSGNGHGRANGHSAGNGKAHANGKNGAGHAQVRIEFEKFTPTVEIPRTVENPFPGIENAD